MDTPTQPAAAGIAQVKAAAQEHQERARLHVQIASLTAKLTRDGKPFLEAELADATDRFTLRVWSDHPAYRQVERFGQGAFVEIEGVFEVSPRYGLEAKSWTVSELAADAVDSLLGGPEELRSRQDTDFATIGQLVASLADPRFAAVAGLFLERHGDRLRRSAAARGYHHARRGGLVEHIAQMMRAADALCAVYPSLHRDLLLTGCLLHDCGKLFENCYEERGFQMPYTRLGELLGHIPVGIELANALWNDAVAASGDAWKLFDPPTDEARLHLLHLIAAHHGEYEFGSPTLPRTPEAVALHHIDNLDAKLEMFAVGYAVAPALAPGIHERVRPLPATLVAQLATFQQPTP